MLLFCALRRKGNVVMANDSLCRAKNAKNDEFYTQLTDIEKELKHYRKHFEGKTVLCNCDDPYESDFFKYFALNFNRLKLKKLIATCFASSPIAKKKLSVQGKEVGKPYKAVVTTVYDKSGDGYIDMDDIFTLFASEENKLTKLKGDGDFRSAECLEILDEADIVVTNPPFSLFREFVAVLMEHKKQFLIIGNKNAITYKDFFPLLKENKVWIGCTNVKEFLQPDGSIKKFGNVGWYTNLDVKKRHEEMKLWKTYTSEEYPKYDNYDAINVNKINDIPCDYCGVMGVPITFMDNYNPDQFEILGYTGGLGWNNQNEVKTSKEYLDCKQHNPDGSITSGGKVNTGAALYYANIPAQRYYTASNCDGYLLRTYGRILIRNKHPEVMKGE